MRESVVEVPAIASRGAGPDPRRFQHDDLRARHGEMAGGGQAGEAAAHDGDIEVPVDRPGEPLRRRQARYRASRRSKRMRVPSVRARPRRAGRRCL